MSKQLEANNNLQRIIGENPNLVIQFDYISPDSNTSGPSFEIVLNQLFCTVELETEIRKNVEEIVGSNYEMSLILQR